MIIEWTNTAVDEFIKILSRYKKITAEKIANEITTRVEGLIKFPQKGGLFQNLMRFLYESLFIKISELYT